MTRRTMYRVAGESLLVEARDRWAADAIDALFAGWYLAESEMNGVTPVAAIVMRTESRPVAAPAGSHEFEIAGGTCHVAGGTTYLDIEGSVVAIGEPGRAAVEVWINGPLPLDAPALTQVVSYALAAALRRRRRFELHSGALVDPESGKGLLIVGPSGSGKSTLTVHLASAGWPFLTDDVLVLGAQSAEVRAWPLRRRFAITSETFAASHFLQARTAFEDIEPEMDHKQQFLPHDVFTGGFTDECLPGTLMFPELTRSSHSRVSRLSASDTMARLIRMNPWSCYDRSTAPEHLAVLSALARQSTGYSLLAGRDLLDAEASVTFIANYARE